jgi:hypothetical protein
VEFTGRRAASFFLKWCLVLLGPLMLATWESKVFTVEPRIRTLWKRKSKQDGGHEGFGERGNPFKEVLEHGKELADVPGTSFNQRRQIDASAKNISLTGEYSCSGRPALKPVERVVQSLGQFQVERVPFATDHAENHDCAPLLELDHGIVSSNNKL